MNKTIKFVMPELHEGQQEIFNLALNSSAMYYTICTPRQFGKSFLAVQLMLYYALTKPNSQLMFCSPVYAQASKIFKELVKGIDGAGLIKKNNAAENSIIFINGSELYFKSIQIPDNLRGYSIDYMFLDEAAMYKDDIFDAVLKPMLTVRGKKCFLFSTPKGKNWFYRFYYLGKDNNPRYCSYQGSSDTNPFANKQEIEDARKVLPPNIFRQEYLAEFIEDGGEVFTNYGTCATVNVWEAPNPNKRYFAGLDLGRQSDFTVLTILDETGKMVYQYRKNLVSWNIILNDVIGILNKYKPRKTLIEVNGNGDTTFDMIKSKYPNVTPWTTSNSSKQNIIESLIYAFEENKLAIPTEKLAPELHHELSDFGYKYKPSSRNVFYGARNGHDDCVMSLAIAYEAYTSGKTSKVSVHFL